MFTNNRRYIAENETRDDYIALDLRLSSPDYKWSRAIEIMRNRIKGRYLDPMNVLIHDNVNKNGFAAMALCCLLIETLMQFREGLPMTPSGENLDYYKDFLKQQIGEVFNTQKASRFYKDIRCGILHSAQTKNGSCLTFDTNYVVQIQGNGVMMVNVQGMYDVIDGYFERYCTELVNTQNVTLRKNFINKMDDITKKWDGDRVIDNLWFAICEKENIRIERENRRPFSFQVVSDGKALKINGGFRITKEQIEDALYYWPNERAILMLDRGSFILPILQLCHNIADDIIRKKIA